MYEKTKGMILTFFFWEPRCCTQINWILKMSDFKEFFLQIKKKNLCLQGSSPLYLIHVYMFAVWKFWIFKATHFCLYLNCDIFTPNSLDRCKYLWKKTKWKTLMVKTFQGEMNKNLCWVWQYFKSWVTLCITSTIFMLDSVALILLLFFKVFTPVIVVWWNQTPESWLYGWGPFRLASVLHCGPKNCTGVHCWEVSVNYESNSGDVCFWCECGPFTHS